MKERATSRVLDTKNSLLTYKDLADLKVKSTEILNISKKWRLFKSLEKFKEKATGDRRLVQVEYRDRVYTGYFTDFTFTEDVRSPWNWKYSLSITVLSWKDNYEF